MIDLTIKQIDPKTRNATVEAPDGFVVRLLDQLPDHLAVGETISIDDELWQQWRKAFALGPPPDARWFEMADLKRHTYNNKVWIPLYAQNTISETGEFGYEGFLEEHFKAYSIVVPQQHKEKAFSSTLIDLECQDEEIGDYCLVLELYFEIERKKEIHIHQDIVFALGLKREGDIWVCPEEDYVEVIRLKRNSDGEPIQVDIRAEFLKDYLCAKDSGLLLTTYQSRKAIRESFEGLNWTGGTSVEETADYKWEGNLQEKSEGNSLLDILGGAIVSHAGRTDTDYSEDIPVYGFPTDNNTFSNSWTVKSTGRKLKHAAGEIWKKEWIAPATRSPRVRGDEVPSKIEFIVDNEGNTETSQTLTSPSRWLWFHPNVINDLLKKRTGVLSWHTEDTGNVGGAWNRSVHFGVNSIGLVNVYAKDIARMREIDKKTWASHNISPEGRVSEELLMSQMEARPAETVAPEQVFFSLINEIQDISKSKLGSELFRSHSSEEYISRKIHRFQATTLEGFYLLCKEMTRFLIERIDMDVLKKLKKDDEKLRTLKRLENILTALGYEGRKIMGVLVGVYDLRIADAHLPSTDKITESMKLVGIDYEEMKLNSGKQLIENTNVSLARIKEAFEEGDFSKIR
jgi:hypothetical protein